MPKYCHFCESEAVSLVEETGTLLCTPCQEAYEFGGSDPGPARRLDSYAIDVSMTWTNAWDRGYQLPPEAKPFVERQPVLGAFVRRPDLTFASYDTDRVAAMFRVLGVVLTESEEGPPSYGQALRFEVRAGQDQDFPYDLYEVVNGQERYVDSGNDLEDIRRDYPNVFITV